MNKKNEQGTMQTEEAALSLGLEKLVAKARNFLFKKLKPRESEQRKIQSQKQ